MTERTAPNYHAITLSYLGPTDFKGARIKLTDQRFGDSITLSRDYATQAIEQGRGFLIEKGYTIVGEAELANHQTLFMVDEFVELKQATPEVCADNRRTNERGEYVRGEK